MTEPMIHKTLFVTMPRSGHTVLIDCLQKIFGDGMKYCEYYGHCNEIPCVDDETNVQKCHDFNLDLVVPEGWNVIVQWREPIHSILSWHQLNVSARLTDMSEPNVEWFFKKRGEYCRGFIKKWIIGYGDAKKTITYNDLTYDPAAVLWGTVCNMINSGTVYNSDVVAAAGKIKDQNTNYLEYYERNGWPLERILETIGGEG